MGSVAMTDEVYARLDGAEGELRNRVNAIDNVVKKYKQMLDEKSSLGSDPEERLWDDYYEEQFAEALGSMSFKVAMRSPIKPLYSYLEEDTRKFLDATDLSTHTFNVTVYNGGTAEAREVQDGSLWFKVNPDSRTATVTHCDIASSAATVEIPATITYAHRTFTVTEIGNIAFYNRKIASVKLPERLKKICNAAFADTDISALEFPASLTELDEGALCGMPRLKSITIPGTVKNIPHLLLANNKSLTTAVLPQNVNEMGKGVFIDCTALTSVTLPQNITALPESTFENCKSLTRLDIPDSVTKYEQLCFYGCTALKSLPMGENVTQLEWRAFAGCTGLTAITVPARVNFGMLVFENCRNLRAATIGSQYKEPQNMNELTNIFSNCPVMPVKAGLHSGNIKFHDK